MELFWKENILSSAIPNFLLALSVNLKQSFMNLIKTDSAYTHIWLFSTSFFQSCFSN